MKIPSLTVFVPELPGHHRSILQNQSSPEAGGRRLINVNQLNNTGLNAVYAAAANHAPQECIERLISLGCDLNCAQLDGATPMFVAAQSGSCQLVTLLASRGADVNASRLASRQTSPDGRTTHNGNVWTP